MRNAWVFHAQAAVFPAVLVAICGIETDRVSGFVHQGTVSDSHHVAAEAGVDGRTAALVRSVPTVVVSVASPIVIYASTVITLPFAVSTDAGGFITAVQAVIITIALPPGIDTFGAVHAFELVGIAGTSSAVPFVPAVQTVVVAVTDPGVFDAQEIVTLDLAGRTFVFVTVYLVREIAAVI